MLNTLVGLAERYRHRYHPFHRLRRFAALRRIARKCDVQLWTRLHAVAHPVRLSLIRHASYLVNRRSPEPKMAALFAAVLDTCPIAAFWDVGAHIGYYSWLVHSLQPAARVLAIEPDPTNVALLRQTQAYAPAVQVLNVAVSRSDGSATFLRDAVTGTTGTLETGGPTFNERHYGESRISMDVRTRSLDSLLQEYGAPDLVKIDVEGHERAVLDGAAAVLAAQPIVFIETFHPDGGALALLHAAGYHVLAAASLSRGSAADGNYFALPCRRLELLAGIRRAYAQHLAALGFSDTSG